MKNQQTQTSKFVWMIVNTPVVRHLVPDEQVCTRTRYLSVQELQVQEDVHKYQWTTELISNEYTTDLTKSHSPGAGASVVRVEDGLHEGVGCMRLLSKTEDIFYSAVIDIYYK